MIHLGTAILKCLIFITFCIAEFQCMYLYAYVIVIDSLLVFAILRAMANTYNICKTLTLDARVLNLIGKYGNFCSVQHNNMNM